MQIMSVLWEMLGPTLNFMLLLQVQVYMIFNFID